MKKLVTFVSNFRVNAILCCSAAALLSACGAGVGDDTQGQLQTAGALSSSAQQPAVNSRGAGPVVAGAAADPGSAAVETAPASGAPAEAPAPAADAGGASTASTASTTDTTGAATPMAPDASAGKPEAGGYNSNTQLAAGNDPAAQADSLYRPPQG